MNLEFHCTDGGRPAREKKDCTVRALAKCFGLPYEEAHKRLKRLGRKNGNGWDWCEKTLKKAKIKVELRPDLCCKMLKSIAPELRDGRFVVRVPGHVFAVIDGVAYDLAAPTNQQVKMVYQCTDL